MAERPLPPPEDDPGIADASALFRDTPAETRPAAPPEADPGGLYEVQGAPEPEADEPSPPPTVRPSAGPPKAKPSPRWEPSEAVEEVWSRGAEWGGTVAALAVAGAALAVVVYLLLGWELYGLAFLGLVGGGAGLAVLAYPILITLERPVRVTPEQAVQDYYGALSHHAPHYRRMWLLLSKDGRVSGSYASFEGFRAYWKARLAGLRQGRAGGFTPLKFQVEGFRSEKSAGKTRLAATYSVQVFIRGRQHEGPVETVQVETSLVKGPDRMWYLDRGTLP